MIGSCDFTEEHYRAILRMLLDAGYEFIGYRELRPSGRRQIILRHDVDLSLDDALRVARWDADLGVSSTFHCLVTADVYNLASARSQAVLREIRALGHRLGLHVDAGDRHRPVDPADLERVFQLGALVLGPLDSYSIHRVASHESIASFTSGKLPFATPPCVHEAPYTEILYRSDSRREWRHGCVCRDIEHWAGRAIQLLLHPIWWSRHPTTRWQGLQDFTRARGAAVQAYLEENLSFYRADRDTGQGA